MEPLRPGVRLYESAIEAIQQYIVRERLRPGDALPSEREMQQQLGISRGPVREALRVLQRVGMIEARQGKGLFVRQMTMAPMIETYIAHLDLIDETSFGHLLELRYGFELGIADLAARNRTDEDLLAMESLLARMVERIERNESIAVEDFGFHELLVRATQNPLFVQLYASLHPLLLAIRQRRAYTAEEVESCRAEHTAIFKAVKAGDASRTLRLMQVHMAGLSHIRPSEREE